MKICVHLWSRTRGTEPAIDNGLHRGFFVQAQNIPVPSPDLRILPLDRAPCCLGSAQALLGARTPVFLEHQWPADSKREPAQVRLGHANGALHLLAFIPDASIVSLADGPNQRTWTLGDTFEMFFQAEGEDPYVELHIAPHGHRLQLRFPSETLFQASREREAFEEFLLPDPSFQSQTAIVEGGWLAWAAVPSGLIAQRILPLVKQTWRFSFCRYDYDAIPGEPVYSSTSAYAELDFHRIDDWGTLRFTDAPSDQSGP